MQTRGVWVEKIHKIPGHEDKKRRGEGVEKTILECARLGTKSDKFYHLNHSTYNKHGQLTKLTTNTKFSTEWLGSIRPSCY